ncbi:hypothetical protein GTQ34_11690 [Muricauda sp. JGD-17]|uniref:DUF6265 domain-containing protein n=1 Tax=Flagellimonas ochracea TaxID=2696472 RepID=A0A964TCX8_9FLAO|nr:DUF6265 family protein [Allomuricauda ochracea]NAY92580.1 hypothetical protein [Allomuricauda ochracea]
MKTLIFFFLGLGIATGQKTLQWVDGQTSPPASLENVKWIAGHWQGEAFGGIAEEIWSPPLGNSMMFVYKMVKDNKISFYEVGHIQGIDNTLILQLKHFHGNLHGWEEKEETIDFKLIKIENGVAFFDGFTIEKVNENQMNMHVLIGEDEKVQEMTFAYKRVE